MTAIEVDGVVIAPELIRAEAAQLREAEQRTGREVTPADTLRILAEAEQSLIDRTLLASEVNRLAITAAPEEIEASLARVLPRADGVAGCRAGADTSEIRAEIEQRIRIDKLVEAWTRGLPRPTSRQIREAYENNREQFWIPEFLFVSHIVRNVNHPDEREPARAAMEAIGEELARGADFAALADAYSDCPGNGGKLGYICRGEMVPEFDEVIFNLPLNKISAVFETRFGFHIAKVTERKPAGILPFSEVASRISASLMKQIEDRELGDRLRALRSRASIRRVKI
jgi:hypothetical protein